MVILNIHTANPKIEFQDCFQWFVDQYGHCSKQDQINNKELMKRVWNPRDGFEALVTQIMEAITYATFARAFMSDQDIVNIAIGVIMRGGMLAKAYMKWHEQVETARMWIDFQTCWRAQLKMRRLVMITAGQMGYCMNAAETARRGVSKQQMDSFGQSHLARQDTTNNELGFLKQQNQMIMQQMA